MAALGGELFSACSSSLLELAGAVDAASACIRALEADLLATQEALDRAERALLARVGAVVALGRVVSLQLRPEQDAVPTAAELAVYVPASVTYPTTTG